MKEVIIRNGKQGWEIEIDLNPFSCYFINLLKFVIINFVKNGCE